MKNSKKAEIDDSSVLQKTYIYFLSTLVFNRLNSKFVQKEKKIKMLDFSLFSWFLLGVISWFIYKVYIWPYYLSPLRNIPGPPSESLIYGNFKAFFVEEVG